MREMTRTAAAASHIGQPRSASSAHTFSGLLSLHLPRLTPDDYKDIQAPEAENLKSSDDVGH